MTPLEIATLFHETYERLAPSFGYETRPDTKAFDPTSANGKLMIAVCGEVASKLATPSPVQQSGELLEVLEKAERRIVELYRGIAPGGNYGANKTGSERNESTFADNDEIVSEIRQAIASTPPQSAHQPASGEVIQVDRDRAAELAQWLTNAQGEWENMPVWFAADTPRAFRDGAFDSHEFVQAFKAHRLAHQPAGAGVAELRGALAKILPIGDDRAPGDRVIPIYVRMDELRNLRRIANAAIPATPQQGEE